MENVLAGLVIGRRGCTKVTANRKDAMREGGTIAHPSELDRERAGPSTKTNDDDDDDDDDDDWRRELRWSEDNVVHP
jgi:hypothetical protein